MIFKVAPTVACTKNCLEQNRHPRRVSMTPPKKILIAKL